MKLIQTGQMEAIELHYVHSSEVLLIERKIAAITQENGGFASILLGVRRGIIHLAECTTSHVLHREQKSSALNR